jgi:phospholipase D1/2
LKTYIHAKGMVVDDRIAIIGSANINERSQRGDRDSELACIIRDTDMIDSTMGGKPYKVGRFAHTMRVRLMREHLGIDVDELEAAEGRAELESREPEKMQEKKDEWDPDQEQSHGTDRGAHAGKTFRYVESAVGTTASYAGQAIKGATEAAQRGLQIGGEKVASGLKVSFDDAENKPPDTDEETHADRIVQGQEEGKGFASTVVPTLEEKVMTEHRPPPEHTEPGGIRKLRQAAEREREEGPTTSPPAEAREPEEQENLSDRISRPPKNDDGEKVKSTARDGETASKDVPSFDDQEEAAATRRLGDKVTQTSDLDDTRKIPMQSREDRIIDPAKDAPPLSPIDEDGRPTDKNGADQSDLRMRKEKQAGSKIEIAEPTPESAPPDISNAHKSHQHQHQNRLRSRSTSTAASSSASTKVESTSKAHGNEQAVNRNEITGKLRRNLRERGAYSIPLPAPKIDPYGFTDPLVDSFYKDVWLAASVRNTQIYRKVFRCMPDDLVQTWKQYREFQVRFFSSSSSCSTLLILSHPRRTGRNVTTRFVFLLSPLPLTHN